jgi:phospholipid/cholesterol/gamma-HCH transport system permease protein
MDATTNGRPAHGVLDCTRPTRDTLCVRLSGRWTIHEELPSAAQVQSHLDATPPVKRLVFDGQDITEWDSGLLTFLRKLGDLCAQGRIEIDYSGLPQGVQRLLQLATAVPEREGARRGHGRIFQQVTAVPEPEGARRQVVRESVLVRVGKKTLAILEATQALLEFLGQAAIACGTLLHGRARFRRADFLLLVQETGAQALPIVSLISFLVGLILAFVGAMQLRQFGAQIYVANLVGLGMAREMGAMMTGIIMAGRTGAAFAAQLGSMTVNQEVDALITMGVSPMEFLVLPRLLALALMAPLLCIYANLVGILGGAVVGVGLLDLGPGQYYQQTVGGLHLTDFIGGLVKGAVFGIVVALAGCLRGMQCARSAAAVGDATMSAVVTAIVWIIVCDALLTIIYDILGV